MASLYEISVPLFIRQLEQLSLVLKKGEAWCEANNVDKTKLLEGKLADDMLVSHHQTPRTNLRPVNIGADDNAY